MTTREEPTISVATTLAAAEQDAFNDAPRVPHGLNQAQTEQNAYANRSKKTPSGGALGTFDDALMLEVSLHSMAVSSGEVSSNATVFAKSRGPMPSGSGRKYRQGNAGSCYWKSALVILACVLPTVSAQSASNVSSFTLPELDFEPGNGQPTDQKSDYGTSYASWILVLGSLAWAAWTILRPQRFLPREPPYLLAALAIVSSICWIAIRETSNTRVDDQSHGGRIAIAVWLACFIAGLAESRSQLRHKQWYLGASFFIGALVSFFVAAIMAMLTVESTRKEPLQSFVQNSILLGPFFLTVCTAQVFGVLHYIVEHQRAGVLSSGDLEAASSTSTAVPEPTGAGQVRQRDGSGAPS